MQMPLQREGWATKSLRQSDRQQMMALAGISLAAIAAPLFLKAWLPNPLRTALLGVATTSSGVLTALAYDRSTAERKEEQERIERVQQALYKNGLAHEVNYQQILGDLLAKHRLAQMVQQLPISTRAAVAQQYGLMPYVQFPEQTVAIPARPVDEPRPIRPGSVMGFDYEEPPAPVPTQDWISDLVEKFAEPDEEKRLYAHLIVNGPTKSGKSTLVSKLLEMMAGAIVSTGKSCQIMLIDPKYPKTKWPLKPAFTGFAMVHRGLQVAVSEFRKRKEACIEAERDGRPHPVFARLIVVVDEQDSIYGEGKGHPELGGSKDERRDTAQDIHAIEVNLLKESAAYDISLFIVGQSPLSGATGFSRSDMQQACRVVLGNEALKWLNDKEFPFKEDVPELSDSLKYWMDQESRVALICPNMGRAYVEAIPRLQITQIDLGQGESQPTGEKQSPKPAAKLPRVKPEDPIAALKQWIEDLGRFPEDSELIIKFEELTGSVLNEKGLQLVKEKLNEPD